MFRVGFITLRPVHFYSFRALNTLPRPRARPFSYCSHSACAHSLPLYRTSFPRCSLKLILFSSLYSPSCSYTWCYERYDGRIAELLPGYTEDLSLPCLRRGQRHMSDWKLNANRMGSRVCAWN